MMVFISCVHDYNLYLWLNIEYDIAFLCKIYIIYYGIERSLMYIRKGYFFLYAQVQYNRVQYFDFMFKLVVIDFLFENQTESIPLQWNLLIWTLEKADTCLKRPLNYGPKSFSI